ncbi:two-component response regulator-like APRR1 isoform X2 [Ziziphus jujuba]|uniref:Two-component response regulator-like APRR1 isoform X2 n=1 Tax=Ziziphus jujuba TaxID=326968 RepID=A0A6P4ASY4_ZIZJJ|nr:two-component response regulator-like APRR1 isoform X2 [Ziziphus jujuba]
MELNLNKECESGGGCGRSRGGGIDGFIDRSKVRILLCDNDSESSREVFTLLLSCSYQVVSVRTAREVIDALNAEGQDIDIILAEVDLPVTKGMKMLKYITRDKDLRRIPVIMMSAQDEVSVVVKCLRLGAADYLVKPLRVNELLNLWTHMWRRRRLIGLADKNILNYDLDLMAPEPSDANTNSTTMFSDDTDDRSHRSTNLEMAISVHQEDESAAATVTEPPLTNSVEYPPDVPGITDRRTGQFSIGPKKSELKIGESSAFFTYVKLSTMQNNSQAVSRFEVNTAEHVRVDGKHQACGNQGVDDLQVQHQNGEAARESTSPGDDLPSSTTSFPDSLSMERSCTPPSAGTEFLQHENDSKEENFSQVLMHPRNESQHNVSGLPAYPYCVSGFMNQVMMSSSSVQVYQKNLHDIQNHATTSMIPQYNHPQHNHLPQCPPRLSGMGASFPYYPFSICLQPGQMPTAHSWPSFGSSSGEVKLNRIDRREAALIKFRQKRKERCFVKKIRYVNRKRLAERRPRVRGQFVRKVKDVMDLNGQPATDQ